MKFQKGNTYGQGRPKGSPNKATSKAREFLQSVSDELAVNLLDDLKDVQPLERIKVWLSLQEYLLPKLSRLEMKDESEEKQMTINISYPEPDYSRLSIDELKQLEKLLIKCGEKPILKEDDGDVL